MTLSKSRKSIICILFICIIAISSCQKKKARQELIDLIGSERYDEAIELAGNYIKKYPKDPEFYYSRGWAYFGLKRIAEAKLDFEKSIKIDSNSYYGYKGMANIYSEKKMYDLAEKYFNKAIDLAKNNERKYAIIGNLANMFYKRKIYDKAIKNYNKAIELVDGGSAYLSLGWCYYKKNNKKKAEELWLIGLNKKFREIKFKHMIYSALVIYYFYDKNEYNKALEFIEKAIDLSPNNNDYLNFYKDINRKIRTKS